jgi:2-polyprenyl-6-methoxyphenol hydroxylase-like FAD-dependent oxidoreductase
MPKNSADVLIVGAGPTGLLLALLLSKLGIEVALVDAAAEAGTTSRALAVQARTLEFYRQVGIAKEVIERGLIFGDVNLWRRGAEVAHLNISAIGHGVSPSPFALIFPQDEHERLLIAHLEARGVKVERRTSIRAIESVGDRMIARGTGPDGGEVAYEASFVAGCDGARSTLRGAIGADFPGGTYSHIFYVADIEARGRPMNKQLHVFLDDAGFLALFPLAGEGRARLIGTIKSEAAEGEQGEPAFGWDDVDRRPVTTAGLEVTRVNWFSTYRVHHRVADRFRAGNVFLLGDAGHIHSPVGGQGMNTGLGDAMNLAWKLAAVIGRRARPDLLATYEPERIAFARRLVATTDRAFKAVTSESKFAEIVRLEILPHLLPSVANTHLGQRFLFAVVSQTGIEYRASALSEGRAGTVHAGDRLPWVAPEKDAGADNFTPLESLDWQAHVYGIPPEGVEAACAAREVPLHRLAFDSRAEAAGFARDAVYLVRPDGYVGGAFSGGSSAAGVGRYLETHGIQGR